MNSRIYIGSKNQAISHIKNDYPGHSIVFVDDPVKHIKSYSIFFDKNKLFFHDNPSNENLKIISQQIDNNKGLHFLFYNDDSFDGRISLISKIKKANNIIDLSPPVVGDLSNLKRAINKALLPSVEMDYDCYEWLYKNCPLMRVKSKISKKEKICYDIDLLSQEINKLTSINNKITIEDFSESLFNKDGDIFEFIEALLSNNKDKSLHLAGFLCESIGEQGLLMILLYQLYFLLKISSCKEKNIRNSDEVISILELQDLLGKYYDNQWTEINFAKLSENPIRVKIELSKNTKNTQQLSTIINTVVDAIKDLRNNGSRDHVLFFMISKICSV
jgi:hypothetical protein